MLPKIKNSKIKGEFATFDCTFDVSNFEILIAPA